MSKFTDKLIRFMYGRYGADALYRFCMVLFLILLIISLWVETPIISILNLALVLWMLFRMFSKNIERRRKENEMFLKATAPLRSFWSLQRMRIKERKTKRFRRCPHCRTILRLPIRKGKHVVNCPVCHQEVHVTILF